MLTPSAAQSGSASNVCPQRWGQNGTGVGCAGPEHVSCAAAGRTEPVAFQKTEWLTWTSGILWHIQLGGLSGSPHHI